MTMLNRVEQLEMSSRRIGRAHWISAIEPGQTVAQAIAVYEALHGPIGKDDMVCHWEEFEREVPSCLIGRVVPSAGKTGFRTFPFRATQLHSVSDARYRVACN